jgi:hypothetical protein
MITMIQSRRKTWAGHIASIDRKRNTYSILVGNQLERGHYEEIDVGGSTTLKSVLKK